MRMRDLPAAIRRRLAPAGAHHRGAAARVRPYAPPAPRPTGPPAAWRTQCYACGTIHEFGGPCPQPRPRHAAADDEALYARRRIVPSWAPAAISDQPPAVPTGDGLDDVRAALEGPIRAWLAMQADQAPAGGVRELVEVTA